MKINDPQQKENIKEILAQGQTTEFWLLIGEALDQSIQRLERERDGADLKELPADQYKLEDQLLKAKIHYLKHLKDLPATIGKWIEQPDQTQPNLDPYPTAKDFLPPGSEADVGQT